MKLVAGLGFALIAVTVALAQEAGDQSAPKQPVPFSHKLHVSDLKQPCKSCHGNPDPGEMVDMPEAAKCMSCHSGIQPKTAGERKLAAFAKQNRDLDWARVYQIPTFVRFSHRQHTEAGVTCEGCHGPVSQRVELWQERPMTMGSCMDCHRQMKASLDCGSCLEPR